LAARIDERLPRSNSASSCTEKALSKLIGMALTVNQQYENQCMVGATTLLYF
jgi:hypothetical protein